MKRIKVFFIILAIVLGGILLFWNDLVNFYLRNFVKLPQVEKELSNFSLEKIEKQIATPPPLRATEQSPKSFLSKEGVIYWTNLQRQKYGLPPLKENDKLNLSAELKVKDMFENQYFAHDSPSGQGVADLAKKVDYQFIAIGENLALGNFENDEVLVESWMDSPGHRANILNNRYQEIGVAVLKGNFEGKSTWLAVQHFGLPLSACPQPDETLKLTIEANKNKIEEMLRNLEILQKDIKTMGPKYNLDYQEKINEYNQLVAEYNLLVEQTKEIVNKYNSQVKLFNDCLVGAQ